MQTDKLEDRDIVEKVFENSDNDYLTVLAVARRARQILDDYDNYADVLEIEKATNIALREYLAGRFDFTYERGKKRESR